MPKKKIQNRIEYICFKIALGVLKILPAKASKSLLKGLFWFGGQVLGIRKNIALIQLSKVYPEKSRKEKIEIIKKLYRNMALSVYETYLLDDDMLYKNIRIQGRENIDKALSLKRGVIFATAHYGNRTQPLLNIGASVVAIEPQKKCYEYLEKKFGNAIQLVTKGLGEKEAIEDFYVASASTISSFSKDWIDAVKQERFKSYTWSAPVKIPITTLDKLIEKYGKPHFIKIDVEGYELEVLKGLTQAINWISFEYTVPEQTQKAIDCILQIQKFNPNIQCNYSIEESMEFALSSWLPADAFMQHLSTQEFMITGFGDIYIRTTL